jgi:hypothetical protein
MVRADGNSEATGQAQSSGKQTESNDDFRDGSVNGFLYQLSIPGAQVTVVLTF